MITSRLDKLLVCFEQDRDDPFIRYGIALEYVSRDEYDTACAWFEELRRDFPDYLPTYLMFGNLYRAMEKLQDAKVVYEEGIKVARKEQDMHILAEIRTILNSMSQNRLAERRVRR